MLNFIFYKFYLKIRTKQWTAWIIKFYVFRTVVKEERNICFPFKGSPAGMLDIGEKLNSNSMQWQKDSALWPRTACQRLARGERRYEDVYWSATNFSLGSISEEKTWVVRGMNKSSQESTKEVLFLNHPKSLTRGAMDCHVCWRTGIQGWPLGCNCIFWSLWKV